MLLFRLRAQSCTPVICCLSLLFTASDAIAVDLHPGDIIVSARDSRIRPGQDVMLRVDPTSGDIDVITSPTVGSGPNLYGLGSITLDAQGQILAGGQPDSGGGIMRINPATGDRTILSDATHGSGPALGFTAVYLQTLPDDSILTYSPGQNDISVRLLRVDPITGDRSLVPIAPFDDPPYLSPAGISVAPNGDTLIGSYFPGRYVVRLDLDTGEHSIVSGSWPSPDIGTGPSFSLGGGITDQTFDPSGQDFYVLQQANLMRVDPATGNRELVSSWEAANPKGTGPYLGSSYGLSVLPDGDLLVVHGGGRQLIRINPLTGDRSLLIDLSGGDLNYSVYDIAVVPQPVPEPGTVVLAGIGILTAVMMRRRFGVRTYCRPQ